MKIAIIGSGISGLTAAKQLCLQHDITVYEKNNYIGGHTATIELEISGQKHAVDTGFIVYNDWTYPHFCKLINQLGISSQPTDMGFSVTTRHQADGDLEYCGSTLRSLFADAGQIFRPAFLGMLKDIVRFGRTAKQDLAASNIPADLPLEQYIDQGGYGRYFRDYYIYPMASAIWSSPTAGIADFDALFFVRFFANHGLLNIFNRPQWRVLRGGSNSYIPAITSGFHDRIRLTDPVRSVERQPEKVIVGSASGTESFDQVIFACHSDQALEMLADVHLPEQEVLAAIPYRQNSVVVHTDETLLPRRRAAWTSWNYLVDGSHLEQPVLTYDMNILQGIKSDRTICVSVNGDHHIDPTKILAQFTYAHPQFSRSSILAQERWAEINGHRGTWFCGAYWANGFHEDGVVSALRVSDALGGQPL